MTKFVGRKVEIKKILDTFNTRKGVINVIRGRRRIGKTTLIKELAHQRKGVTLRYLTSPPPRKDVSDEAERNTYALQVKTEFGLPFMPPHDTWQELFYFIISLCNEKKTILAIDEVNWLARKSSTPIENILWEVWERECAQKAGFMMILAGSLASWLEENIISHEGFVGRIAETITLKELRLSHVREFFGARIDRAPQVDVIKLLCAFGGVPLYLEYIDLKLGAEENINKLAYSSSGSLHTEFDQMFNELFSAENQMYRKILDAVGDSSKLLSPEEIAQKVGVTYTGRINNLLKTLCEIGFLKKETTWDTKKKKRGIKQRFRISDNYTAFYFRSIKKHAERVENTGINSEPLNVASILGLQFEVLALNNIDYIVEQLGVKNPIFIGGYFQTKTQRQEACQIDILIQTKSRLYICECKLLNEDVGTGIIKEVQTKIDRLTKDKKLSCHPVLIHANGVSHSVEESDYFDRIIDLRDALRS